MTDSKSLSLTGSLLKLYSLLPRRRQQQLLLLLGLMLLTACSEILTLGAAIPFLAGLSDAEGLLERSELQPAFIFLGITTAPQVVIFVGITFALSVFLANGLRLLTLRTQQYLAAAVATDLSQEVYHRTLYQPYVFHVRHNSSDLIATITQDVGVVGAVVLPHVFLLLVNSLVVGAITVTLLIIDIMATVTVTFFLGIAYFFLIRFTKKKLTRNSLRASDLSRLLVKYLQEGLGGIREVLIDGSQRVFEARYKSVDRELRRTTASTIFIGQAPRYLIEAVGMGFIATLATSMAYQTQGLERIVPVLGTLALGANRLLPALQTCFNSLTALRGSEISLQRAGEALERPIDANLSAQLNSPSITLRETIELNNVWFRYSDSSENWVLSNLCLQIPANRTVAFVGSTGSGKSTTADLIIGLLTPQRGEVNIDGLPLHGKRLRAWQNNITHVPQSIFLSDSSIAENIAFGISYEAIDFERVRQAARLAQMTDFIEGLPAGYDTLVGERGVRLSGGQRQRVGIARALYKRASVIVFDEATSALDNLTEQEVMAAIHGLSHEITIILIAHRLSTVKNCDLIFELAHGSLVAHGDYARLIEHSPSFRKMAQNVSN